ncbi:hypothetical protein HOH87_08040 [bacterium]|nr:hypothetical protein [bacterium]
MLKLKERSQLIFSVMLGLLALFVLSTPAMALRIELSNEYFSPSGRGANRNLFVTNNTEKMMAVEVYARRRTISDEGSDILAEEDNFLIYPNQLLLQPGEQQVATVTWIGDKHPDQELAFRIVVEQLNLALGDDDDDDLEQSMTVKLLALTKVVKAAYVTPSGAKPDVMVDSIEPFKKDGKTMMKVTIRNRGLAHTIIKNTRLRVSPTDGSGKNIIVTDPVLASSNNMLANSNRVFLIEWPKKLTVGPVTGERI